MGGIKKSQQNLSTTMTSSKKKVAAIKGAGKDAKKNGGISKAKPAAGAQDILRVSPKNKPPPKSQVFGVKQQKNGGPSTALKNKENKTAAAPAKAAKPAKKLPKKKSFKQPVLAASDSDDDDDDEADLSVEDADLSEEDFDGSEDEGNIQKEIAAKLSALRKGPNGQMLANIVKGVKKTDEQDDDSEDDEDDDDDDDIDYDESDEDADNMFKDDDDDDDGEDGDEDDYDSDEMEAMLNELANASDDDDDEAEEAPLLKKLAKLAQQTPVAAVNDKSLKRKLAPDASPASAEAGKKVKAEKKEKVVVTPAPKQLKKAAVPDKKEKAAVPDKKEKAAVAPAAPAEKLTPNEQKALALAQRLAAQLLFVKPLSPDCSVTQLGKLCGANVVNVRIPLHERTGRTRGYAFVTYKSAAAAMAGRDLLQGKELAGKPLTASISGQTTPVRAADFDFKSLFVTGLAKTCVEADVRALYPAADRIHLKCNDGVCLGYAFVFFASEATATAALEATHLQEVDGHLVNVAFSKAKETAKTLSKHAEMAVKKAAAVLAAKTVAAPKPELERGRKRAALDEEAAAAVEEVAKVVPAAKKSRPSVTSVMAEPVKLKRKASELSSDDDGGSSDEKAVAPAAPAPSKKQATAPVTPAPASKKTAAPATPGSANKKAAAPVAPGSANKKAAAPATPGSANKKAAAPGTPASGNKKAATTPSSKKKSAAPATPASAKKSKTAQSRLSLPGYEDVLNEKADWSGDDDLSQKTDLNKVNSMLKAERVKAATSSAKKSKVSN